MMTVKRRSLAELIARVEFLKLRLAKLEALDLIGDSTWQELEARKIRDMEVEISRRRQFLLKMTGKDLFA